MRKIHKKTWPSFFRMVLNGEKTVEMRVADFDCDIGDVLILEEYMPLDKAYTGRKIEKVVVELFKVNPTGFWSMSEIKENGIYLMRLEDVLEHSSEGSQT